MKKEGAVLRWIIKAHGCSLCSKAHPPLPFPPSRDTPCHGYRLGKWSGVATLGGNCAFIPLLLFQGVVLVPEVALKQNKTEFSTPCNPANYVPAFIVTEANIQLYRSRHGNLTVCTFVLVCKPSGFLVGACILSIRAVCYTFFSPRWA